MHHAFIAVLVVATALSAAADGTLELLVDVGGPSFLRVVSAQERPAVPYEGVADIGPTPGESSALLTADYRLAGGIPSSASVECHSSVLDLRTEGLDDEGTHLHGDTIALLNTVCFLPLPLGATAIVLRYRNRTSHSFFRALQKSPSTIVTTTLQYVGDTARQPNLVFLAAGYQSEAMFREDVLRAVHIMQYPLMPGIALSRYFSLLNIFYVYETSEETGASKLLPTAITRKNNLGCYFGTAASRLICDVTKSIALAANAPPKPGLPSTVVVALVNEVQYGGAAIYSSTVKATYFYNGALRDDDTQKMASLLYHEIGHAIGDLLDEYDYKITERRQITTSNCHWEQNNLPWSEWQAAGRVDAVPTAVCGFTNYFKPTTTCIMSALRNPAPCAVCTETTIRHMYDNSMSHFAPVCPHRHEIVYLSAGTDTNATFYVNHLLWESVSIAVTWDVNGTVVAGQRASTFTFLLSSFPTVGTYRLSVTVNDTTSYVLATNRLRDRRNFVQTQSWTVVVVNRAQFPSMFPPLYRAQCNPVMSTVLAFRPGLGASYVASCTPGRNCTAEQFVSHPFNRDSSDPAPADIFEKYVLSVMGAAIAGSLLAFLIVVWLYARHVQHRPRLVTFAATSRFVAIARWAVLAFSIAHLSAAVTALVLGLLVYSAFGVFMTSMAVVALAFVILGAVMACLGLFSWYYLLKRYLVLHMALLLVSFLGLVVACVMCLQYASDISNAGSAVDTLRDLWLDAATSDPSRICYIQKYLTCSGFEVSCPRVVLSSQCPRGCDTPNSLHQDPCITPLTDLAAKWYRVTGWVLFALAIITLAAVVASGALFRFLYRFSRETSVYSKATLVATIQRLPEGEFIHVLEQVTETTPCSFASDVTHFFECTLGFRPTVSDIRTAYFLMGTSPSRPAGTIAGRKDTNDPSRKLNLAAYMTKMRSLTFDPTFDEEHKVYIEARDAWTKLDAASRDQYLATFQKCVESGTPSSPITPSGEPFAAAPGHGAVGVSESSFLGAHRDVSPYLPSPFVSEAFHACNVAKDGALCWTVFTATYGSALEAAHTSSLRCYYQVHNPEKARDAEGIANTIAKWRGREEALWRELTEKYGAHPGDTITTHPALDPRDQSFQEASAVWAPMTQTSQDAMRDSFGLAVQGTWDRRRFVQHFATLMPYLPPEAFVDMFLAFDVDGDGTVSWTGFVARHASALRAIHETYLRRFYRHHNPSREIDVKDTLVKWQGHEEAMWAELTAKYGAFPADGAGSHDLVIEPAGAAAWRAMGSHERVSAVNGYQGVRAGGVEGFVARHAYLPGPLVRNAFQRCDVNRNGILTWTEFVMHYGPAMQEAEATALRAFYEEHAPERVALVAQVLANWKGQEALMWAQLKAKYCPDDVVTPLTYSIASPTKADMVPLPHTVN